MRHLFLAWTVMLALLWVSCGRSEVPSPATSATPSPRNERQSAAGSGPARPQPAIRTDEHTDRTVYDKPFDASSRLFIKATYTTHGGYCCSTVLRVLLIDRADPTRQLEIDTIAANYEYDYKVKPSRPPSVVMCRTDSHGLDAGCVKLFIDPVAKQLLGRVDFDLRQDVAFADDTEAQRLLDVSARDLGILRDRGVFRTSPANDAELPEVFAAHPMPQSTYQAFARARPARVRNGYGQDTKFEERIGAWQAEDGGFWFARTFYDGEGSSGVGAVGFLSRSSQYSFLTIPALCDWSVDAILVEPDVLWAGLVNHGEGPDLSGGLLRYDRQTHRAEIEKVPGVILRIVHVAGAVFLGTTNGLYVLRNGVITWHHMEPDVSGRLVVITEGVEK